VTQFVVTYSLEMYASRPACTSEQYVTTRFPSGTIGLAVPGDCSTAGVGPSESVVFVRLPYGYGRYSDSIKFPNGRDISLQLLGSGVTVRLVQATEKPKVFYERETPLERIA
jgi:hypothetical protein